MLRVAAGAGLLAALGGGGWIWLRDSSLVSVDQVQISGAGGPQGAQIRRALELAARNMTTLDVHLPALRAAVAPYPSVARISVSTSFPHTMRIEVYERRAVAIIEAAGTGVEVADDGTVLRDQTVNPSLPAIALRAVPSGPRVRGIALSEVRLISVAPPALSAHVSQVSSDSVHGLFAQLRNGPRIYFGDASQLRSKWSAAAAVLAQPNAAGAQYIDVTVPARPAAGVGNDAPGQHSG
ncbi:MAG: cell division protein FtsQ/DivIB [Solirubrobacteraceae bacterium]